METVAHRSGISDTHQKLLEAAARVFAIRGLDGATTREIAREAGVNEVTLFRHFQSKDNLLAAVLQRTFDRPEGLGGNAAAADPPEPGDLRSELRRYVVRYEELIRQNVLLLRTLIGEIHRYSEHEVKVFKGIFAPLKVDLLAVLHAARERGEIRPEIDPLVAANLLGSMIFMEVLRCHSNFPSGYTLEHYLETMLDVFVRGIESSRSKP